jgi:hypothetical protein
VEALSLTSESMGKKGGGGRDKKLQMKLERVNVNFGTRLSHVQGMATVLITFSCTVLKTKVSTYNFNDETFRFYVLGFFNI